MDFDEIVNQYDEWFSTPLGFHVDRLEKEITWELARPESGEKVLDIGTGTANYLIELARMGLDCTGLDIGHKMVLRAREKSERGNLKIKLMLANCDALPFPDKHFDLVLSITAFEFFPNPDLAVKEMVRVCKPGGRIVVGVLNRWSTWALRRRILAWFKETIFTDCRFYSYTEMKRFLGQVKWETSVFAPPGLPKIFIPLFNLLEPYLRKILKPFGAYLVVSKEV